MKIFTTTVPHQMADCFTQPEGKVDAAKFLSRVWSPINEQYMHQPIDARVIHSMKLSIAEALQMVMPTNILVELDDIDLVRIGDTEIECRLRQPLQGVLENLHMQV